MTYCVVLLILDIECAMCLVAYTIHCSVLFYALYLINRYPSRFYSIFLNIHYTKNMLYICRSAGLYAAIFPFQMFVGRCRALTVHYSM